MKDSDPTRMYTYQDFLELLPKEYFEREALIKEMEEVLGIKNPNFYDILNYRRAKESARKQIEALKILRN
jgi:hypothetical protein